ncbi:MAG TPA: winged helix DNA-binding domain-containing protein [Actinomycetota bacterium]|nr:winged helix DNA-binding domain-containing protein [Actinomycetota bacterium]
MTSLKWENVRAWRLQRQGLAGRVPAGRMLELTGQICGLHAQVMSSAELTLWARVEGIFNGVASKALWEDRTLVKLWAMRGTLHLLPASEYWMWQAGLSTYDHYLKPSWFKYFGLTRDQFELMVLAVGESLQDRVLNREELGKVVADRTGVSELGEKLKQSWGAYLKPASFRGKLCFGPGTGQKVGFTSPETWLGGREEVDPQEALAQITRRYLDSNGPSTREEYGRWWAISPAKALARIKKLGDEVAEVDVEGQRCWMLSAAVDEAAAAGPENRVNLVPAFDQYVIAATRQAQYLTSGPNKARIYRPQGWISPVLLVDGRMDGIWSHEVKGRRLTVTVEPFVALPGWAKPGVDAEAQSLAGFLGCDQVELSYKPAG